MDAPRLVGNKEVVIPIVFKINKSNFIIINNLAAQE